MPWNLIAFWLALLIVPAWTAYLMIRWIEWQVNR